MIYPFNNMYPDIDKERALHEMNHAMPQTLDEFNDMKISKSLTDIQVQIINGKICPYCGNEPGFVDSECIYGKSYGMIYLCKPCDAYVGVHKGASNALGRLANKELRYWKKESHLYFDKIWKLKLLTRNEAYKWLSENLELPAKYTHIGMFSVKTCKEVVRLSKQSLNDNRRLDLDFGAKPVTEYYED